MAEYHIEVDSKVYVYRFGIELIIAEPLKDNVIELCKGRHKLSFSSVDYPKASVNMIVEVPSDNYCDFLEVSLSNEIHTIIEQEQRQKEAAAIEAEAKAKKQAEENLIRKEREEIEKKAHIEALEKLELESFHILVKRKLNDPFLELYDPEKNYYDCPIYGFRNKQTKEVVIQPKYDAVEEFDGKYARVRRNDEYFYIDKDGERFVDLSHLPMLAFDSITP